MRTSTWAQSMLPWIQGIQPCTAAIPRRAGWACLALWHLGIDHESEAGIRVADWVWTLIAFALSFRSLHPWHHPGAGRPGPTAT